PVRPRHPAAAPPAPSLERAHFVRALTKSADLRRGGPTLNAQATTERRRPAVRFDHRAGVALSYESRIRETGAATPGRARAPGRRRATTRRRPRRRRLRSRPPRARSSRATTTKPTTTATA